MADTMTPNPVGLYITQITLPNNNTYEIVDENARKKLTDMSNFSAFLGVVSNSADWTKIEDQSTTATILVGSTTMTAVTGNVVIYKPTGSTKQAQEFIFDGTHWNFFGDVGTKDLGTMAYTNTASGTYYRWKSSTLTTATVTSSGSFTPTGSVELTKSSVTLAISSTGTNPGAGNTANYWIHKPAGTVTVTYAKPSASASVVTGISSKKVVTTASVTSPTSAAVTGSLGYASVSDHKLMLSHLVVATDTAATASGTVKAYTGTTDTKATSAFDGTTVYVKPLTVTVATAASFSGTAGTVSVNSGNSKFANAITSTTETATVKVVPST